MVKERENEREAWRKHREGMEIRYDGCQKLARQQKREEDALRLKCDVQQRELEELANTADAEYHRSL